MDGERKDDGRVGRGLGNVPFEFVGEVASAGAVAKASDVERGTTAARHLVMGTGCLCGVVLRDLQVRQVAIDAEVVLSKEGLTAKKGRHAVRGPCAGLAQQPHCGAPIRCSSSLTTSEASD
jgi:hypothetical protein